MALPEQVRRAAERATELQQLAAGESENPGGVTPTPEPPPAPAEATPPDVPASPPAAQPAAPEGHETPPAPAPAATTTAPTEPSWEHKYRTLQGMFNAESGRWQTEKREFESRLARLETPPAVAKPAPQAKAKRVTDQDVEAYGTELLDVIGRTAADIAEAEVARRLDELQPELAKTRDQVTTVAGQVYQNAQDKFYGELAKAVPDWETVNRDEGWLSWLMQLDPLSGLTRQAYLDNASQSMDHARTAALFEAYKNTLAPASAPAAPAAAAPAKPALSPSPRPVGTASAPLMREPQVGVKRTELAAHYRHASSDPAYRRSPEYKAMETRIANAMAEGAILEA